MAGLNLFTNNAATTLASSILVGATSLTVSSGTGALFPTLAGGAYFYCTLSNTANTTIEIIKVTARSTDTFTIVRAQDNTSASAFTAGDKVELRLTAIDLQNFPQLDSTNTFASAQTFTSTPVFSAGITSTATPVGVASGGTGAATLTGVLKGNGTSAFSAATAGTDYAGIDTAQTFTKGQRGEITVLTDGATITPDLADSNNYSVTLAGNRTLANPTNITAGQSGSIFVSQDGTGSRTLAYGTNWDFAGGTAPTLSTAASSVDRIDYVVRTATSIHAVFTAAYS